MGDVINFYDLKKYNVFENDFLNMRKNNKIMFGDKETHIAVLYAPNGTGKTSFVDVVGSDGSNSEIKYRCKYKGKEYNEKTQEKLFYIIKDHHGRNVIKVKETDYIIGENIQREYQLREFLETKQKELCNNEIYKLLKEVGYTTKTNLQYELFSNPIIKNICQKLIIKSEREKCEFQDFYDMVKNLSYDSTSNLDEDKIKYLRENFTDKNSILYLIYTIKQDEVVKNDKIKKIECNNDAISIMIKYPNDEKCIVCENHYLPSEMLEKKKNENEQIISQLSQESKKILKDIIEKINEKNDPFKIKSILTGVITDGEISSLNSLKEEIRFYVLENMKMAGNLIYELFKRNQLQEEYEKYTILAKEEPVITEEDLLFVQEFVRSAIDKEIKLERKNGKIKLTLDNKELYESDYDSLQLSTGEQNFISLSFEFLKAHNRDEKIIVLDDPISSFDSIFKNKIAFSIIKFLKGKNVIVLTHNTDLIRLLEHQLNNCFKLYMFNNYSGAENGFLEVATREKEILLEINKLLSLFRERSRLSVQNEKMYLISLIPFMRAYANLTGNTICYKRLSKVMHGYETKKMNITYVYNQLFCKSGTKIINSYTISVKDILNININNIGDIVEKSDFPLLNKTLYHSICYLYLRMKTEYVLYKKFRLQKPENNRVLKLSTIIDTTLNEKNFETDEERQFIKYAKAKLVSKKTLLNEFNHFEGNMNIFQPAIDISDVMLNKEINEILLTLEKVNELKLKKK